MSWLVLLCNVENHPVLLVDDQLDAIEFDTAEAADKAAREDWEGQRYGYKVVEWTFESFRSRRGK